MNRSSARVIPLLALLAGAGPARAASSSTGEEFLSTTEWVEPNVLFLVDLSSDMSSPCPAATDSTPCIEVALDAIDQVTQHFDWARYGVIGTADDAGTNEYYPIVPLGTSYAEISAALASVSAHSAGTRNFAEALADVYENYLTETTADDGVDSDGDGFTQDWDEAPIEYWCQTTHIITIAVDRPEDDERVAGRYTPSISTDIVCDSTGIITTGADKECLYDNVVYELYTEDARSDLSGDQNIIVHTVGIGIKYPQVGEALYGNASDMIGGAGIYTSASTPDQILSGILAAMQDIRTGSFSRSTPVVTAEGDYLIYTFYEMSGDNPLGEGHIRAYELDDDPASTTYGQVKYDGPSQFGGAVWDGGDLLVSRPVTASESNPDDRDGFGKRDIYTFFEPAVSVMSTESASDRRQGFDRDFAQSVGADATALDTILDATSTVSPPCADDLAYDLSKDDCYVDADDLQALVDFARGLPEATYRYLDQQRGQWKLGDSPHSIPVVVEARNNTFAVDPVYRKFLKELEANAAAGVSPDIVLMAANDGMLHAFQLEDDAFTADTEEGEELWAWLPGFVLYRDHDAAWAGRLVDLMLYGRTFLFDGSPVVEDVWIDLDDDGEKDCVSVPDNCEYRRVVVVQQGKGGPVTLALDITDTNDPEFLWEQTDETDVTGMGYTVSRPVIANVYDSSDSSDPRDRWVVMWGSGRGVPYAASSTFYQTAEANLYFWSVGDDYWGDLDLAYQDSASAGHARGANLHPESGVYGATLDSDSDVAGHYEYAYVSAALAVVDVDSDGDADTAYFPVSTSYSPTSEGGAGPTDISDPGSTWMYKGCIDTSAPGDFTFVEFYDPVDDGGLSTRPEVYYAATASWLPEGSLALYWGTGTPYDRTSSEEGYFFAMKDTAPEDCSGDWMTPMTDCGADGVYTLGEGEGLTADPLVYAGVVYFSTWVPEDDRCDGGYGRLWGLDFENCEPGIDTNGDGVTDASDDEYIEHDDVYVSGITVTESGRLFYGTSDVSTDGTADAVESFEAAGSFQTTAMVSWMEVF